MMNSQKVGGDTQQSQILQSFDFSMIDEMDPSLSSGYKLIFDRELPFHIRLDEGSGEPQVISDDEPLRVRLFVMGEEKNPVQFKVEVNSENDLFFHYTHEVTAQSFFAIKETQQLHITFKEYPGVAIKSLNQIDKEQSQFAGIFTIQKEGLGRMSVIHTTEYKNIELISFDFETSPEETVRQHITFRYGSLKSKLSLMESRLQDVNEILRLKNPSLLLQLQKNPNNIKFSQQKK